MSGSSSLKVLLVEDEALIAMMAEDMIAGMGHDVVRTCATLSDAIEAATSDAFDVALLDVNLNGDSSMPVASVLKKRNSSFAFTTGYGSNGVDDAHRDVPVLTKPYSLAELEALLAALAVQPAGTSSMTSSVDSKRG